MDKKGNNVSKVERALRSYYGRRKHKELECLGRFIGKEVYMELRGGTPLLRSRREIALKGKIVDVKEFNVGRKTVTIEIPLIHLATLSEEPIKPAKRKQLPRESK